MKTFSSFHSNPDLRRSELSLDAMLQRTSSNSSSSSSPSSQGGSAERRGTDTHTHNVLIHLSWQIHLYPCMETIKNQCVYMLLRTYRQTRKNIHVRWHGFGVFQRLSVGHCQSQFCSDQPVWCALLLSASREIEERKWEREIERGVEGCVKHQARGIYKICMDLPLTNTWHKER